MEGFCRTVVVYVVLVCHTTAVPVPERQLPENRTSYAQQEQHMVVIEAQPLTHDARVSHKGVWTNKYNISPTY